ncbi:MULTISPECIES: hypothetical protein [unclassified Nocardioides]|uniref:hypothetical protein n=1 Tax=unclassified Nocardioides TaxID=2615069 RepID=UPI000321406C|nr:MULTISPECIES: hypothetical protein [unclassified Nocardioides]
MSSPGSVTAPPVAERGPRPGEPRTVLGWSRAGAAVLLLAAAAAFAAWLPFLHVPLTADESGFLLLGQHWHPGSSLYGDYWVDRPPLLLWLFSLAGHVTPGGGVVVAPAVKLMGATASAVSVLLAGVLGGLLGNGRLWPRVAAPAVALALLSSPFFGMPETDGEVLAVPFVLLGVVLLLAAVREPQGAHRRRGLALAAGAGAAAMAAALVKQNAVDVFVLAAVLLLTRHGRARALAARAAAFAGGTLAVLAVALAGAAVRGTTPRGIWDAVFVFRLEASAVIGTSSSPATPERLLHLATVFLVSGGAPLLVLLVLLVLTGRVGRSSGLTWPALALVGWELVGVALGGSYWWHYLTGLVPGLVLLVVLAAPVRGRSLVTAVLAYVLIVNPLAWLRWSQLPNDVSSDEQVAAYLRMHAEPSDGVVVAFGHPDIVAASGLSSPYPYLWSLPVRVRDPRLRGLEDMLAGPDAPRWVVVDGDSLASWGLDARAAEGYLVHHYGEQRTYGDWHVWEREEGVGP